MKIKNENLLMSAMQYTSPDSRASAEKAQGVVIGALTTLCAFGYSYEDAIRAMVDLLPVDYRAASIPEAWYEDIKDFATIPIVGWRAYYGSVGCVADSTFEAETLADLLTELAKIYDLDPPDVNKLIMDRVLAMEVLYVLEIRPISVGQRLGSIYLY